MYYMCMYTFSHIFLVGSKVDKIVDMEIERFKADDEKAKRMAKREDDIQVYTLL